MTDPIVTSQSLAISGAILALALSAIGSALGCGTAACAAVGAWKRSYVQGRPASMMLLSFVGAPLSQTIYGMILMYSMKSSAAAGAPGLPMLLIGLAAGLAIGWSAWYQGRAAAAAADSFGETEKGFTNDFGALGVVETVAIFVMVFTILMLSARQPEAAADAAAAAAAVPVP